VTHEDKGHFSDKHPSGRKLNADVVRAVKERTREEGLPCAVAFEVAKDVGVPPEEVGFTADRLEISLIRCQLGLHGYQPERKKIVTPADTVTPELEARIRDRLIHGKLPCKAAWDIAGELGLRKLAVSSACEALGVKISSCQLGAFQ
jgi:hypothetical protein